LRAAVGDRNIKVRSSSEKEVLSDSAICTNTGYAAVKAK